MVPGRGLPLGLRAAFLAMHSQTHACLAKQDCTADQRVLLGLLAREDAVTPQARKAKGESR